MEGSRFIGRPVFIQRITIPEVLILVRNLVKHAVHTSQAIGAGILFLAEVVDVFLLIGGNVILRVEKQGSGATACIVNREAVHMLPPMRDDLGKDDGYLFRGVEFPRLFTGTFGEFCNQVFIGIAKDIVVVEGEVLGIHGQHAVGDKGVSFSVIASEFF